MILPIVSYGHEILKKKCMDIDQQYPALEKLIDDMWETMYPAHGCGLAAPQINHPVRIFIVDSTGFYKNMEQEDRDYFFDGDTGIKETFINAKITSFTEDVWTDDEGCLSLPTISEDIERPWGISISYMDRQFKKHKKNYYGLTARVIQHEYDHTDGLLFIDHLKTKKKNKLKEKLQMISEGQVETLYIMKFIK
jgi:peptide deformylase